MNTKIPITIWYALQGNDGLEVEISWHLTKESALVDVEDDDDYGSISVGSVETFEGSEVHIKARN